MSEPRIIKLVRHGESESNVGLVESKDVGDHNIRLTERGVLQAHDVGAVIGADFIRSSLLYLSPYTRTRQTMKYLIEGAKLGEAETLRFYEEPRLREIDTGYASYKAQQKLRKKFGWFYYRFKGGEAPSDVYDRQCHFLDSLGRQVERKKTNTALIVSHGLTIRCFVMRFMHLTVEQFETLDNPDNCDVITIAHKDTLTNPQFTSGEWGVVGLRLRKPPEENSPAPSKKAAKKESKNDTKKSKKNKKNKN